MNPPPYRIGYGFDLHQTRADRKLILGGVELEAERGLLGHSDADCLTHAISDALLGAIAEGDIGQHFPDNDAANKDLNSRLILKHCIERVRQRGYELANVDATVIAEAPKLAPHRERICQSLAQTLGVSLGQVSIKATTHEKMDALGEGRAISAQATVLLYRTEA